MGPVCMFLPGNDGVKVYKSIELSEPATAPWRPNCVARTRNLY